MLGSASPASAIPQRLDPIIYQHTYPSARKPALSEVERAELERGTVGNGDGS